MTSDPRELGTMNQRVSWLGRDANMKPVMAFGRFGALCPVAEFLGLPVKKVRALRDMGLIRLPGGRTRPEDLAEDWKQHADRLRELREQPATSPAGRRPGGSARPRALPPARVPKLVANFEMWQRAQGASHRNAPS